MAFVKKTWKDRIVQYANRRLLTKSGGEVEQVTVTRDEGTISEAGDQFNASNMNDLEQRVKDGFDEKADQSTTYTKAQVDSLLSGKSNTLLVERKQYLNVTFDNYYKSMSDNISKTGYTPLGVVGTQCATVGVLFFRANIDFGTNTLYLGLVARDGASPISGSVNIYADILYVKNS